MASAAEPPGAKTCRRTAFAGEVARGQRFERRIEGNLVFLLFPDPAPSLGWTVKVIEPSKRKAGMKVADVKALVEKLRNDAKVL